MTMLAEPGEQKWEEGPEDCQPSSLADLWVPGSARDSASINKVATPDTDLWLLQAGASVYMCALPPQQ